VQASLLIPQIAANLISHRVPKVGSNLPFVNRSWHFPFQFAFQTVSISRIVFSQMTENQAVITHSIENNCQMRHLLSTKT